MWHEPAEPNLACSSVEVTTPEVRVPQVTTVRGREHQLVASAGTSPDVRLEVRLNGTATRLAHADVPLREAVAELEALAAGRADLLAVAAGSILGGYLSRPGMSHPQAVYAVALLVLAGADVDLIVEHVDRARRLSTENSRPR